MEYKPAEDTLFLLDQLSEAVANIMLEMGCGSCYIISSLKGSFKVGCDLVKPSKIPEEIDFVLADCRKCPFRESSFELIFFNPPYLPSDKIIDIAVDGGKGGIEIAFGFLKESLRLTKPNGLIYFLVSSLSNYNELEDFIKSMGLTYCRKEKKIFFESLYVYKVKVTKKDA